MDEKKRTDATMACESTFRFEKTHDLGSLGIEAAKKDKNYLPFVELADELSPYATLYRYPGELDIPSHDEYLHAYKTAEKIYLYVQNNIKF